jgi:hypothetical protein
VCGSGHRETFIQDLYPDYEISGPFQTTPRAVVLPTPEQNHFQHFINIYLNKMGQILPVLADTGLDILAHPTGEKIIKVNAALLQHASAVLLKPVMFFLYFFQFTHSRCYFFASNAPGLLIKKR